ncbi:plasmid mobilization protein [Globicatella sp. PHS-GS-PNBC-21-1553]|uniref:plasmid mobilization protein n=1 Tax=Globicatella sp. PHS-GS-PNBC-21-1553 TaxID=2885764 RepID=UPI00298EE384|nr:hypothetical protein [Globicatella sp. PHS-GS-PNBC-21-1553]WPC08080.1 hypothetical protein LB888_08520 [Globicatella sp. PHS-GS-PNBC-21-1553]
MFRRKSLDEISKKVKDKNKKKNRKRNRILNFRVSEDEYALINKKIEISGLKKQDYFIQMLTQHEITLVSDYRLFDNISKEIFQLARVIKKFGKLEDEEAEILIYILEIYEKIKKEKSPYYNE